MTKDLKDRLEAIEYQLTIAKKEVAEARINARNQPKMQAHKWITRHPRATRQQALFAIIIVLVIIGSVSVWLYFSRPRIKTDPFTASIRSSVSIPLYFPTWLPQGYRVDASSITQPQSGTVVLTATNAKYDAIYISEAPVPGGSFDIRTFYGNFLDKKTASTPLGEVSSGLVGGNTKITSLIVNNKTWIIINTKASSTVDDLVTVTRRLQLSQ